MWRTWYGRVRSDRTTTHTGATATLHAKAKSQQWTAAKLALGAALDAVLRGAAVEAIGQCELAKAACVELAVPSPPLHVAEPDEPLEIAAVMALTGYSKSALRRKGHELPGYHKYPNGKVVWWKRQLIAGLQGDSP